MRQDMPKKFLEPSGGKKLKFPRGAKKYKPTGEDNVPKISGEGMRKVHVAIDGWDMKEIGTDMGLLRRWLRSHKGEPWDQVFSEICKEADGRSYEGHHLRHWLDYAVTQNCFMKDGKVYNENGLEVGKWWCQFYVHPEKKTLEWIEPHHKKHRPKQQKQTVFEMDDVLYHEHEGLWYRVKLAPVPEKKSIRGWTMYDTASLNDAFMLHDPPPKLNPWSYWSLTDTLKTKYGLGEDGKFRYCLSKQSANKREIEKLKDKYKDLVA